MSGTYDFIDGAVDSLKAGGHVFVIIALTNGKEPGDYRYSIRSGEHNTQDIDRLERVVKEFLPPHFEDIRNG